MSRALRAAVRDVAGEPTGGVIPRAPCRPGGPARANLSRVVRFSLCPYLGVILYIFCASRWTVLTCETARPDKIQLLTFTALRARAPAGPAAGSARARGSGPAPGGTRLAVGALGSAAASSPLTRPRDTCSLHPPPHSALKVVTAARSPPHLRDPRALPHHANRAPPPRHTPRVARRECKPHSRLHHRRHGARLSHTTRLPDTPRSNIWPRDHRWPHHTRATMTEWPQHTGSGGSSRDAAPLAPSVLARDHTPPRPSQQT